jgi:class 3 adenylate cyclase
MRWIDEGRNKKQLQKSSFNRVRGVVWVCDVINSSKYLNDDDHVDAMEQFLQRLYEISNLMVGAARGEFIKWTGDGFLAWFETDLYREINQKATYALSAARQLSLCLDITQLGISSPTPFKIRHGITYEHDGVSTNITSSNGQKLTDLLGRNIVLAFRLSGIEADFPRIVSQWEIVNRCSILVPSVLKFKSLKLRSKEIDKYFKGEKEGTDSICVTTDLEYDQERISQGTTLMFAENEISITADILSQMYTKDQWIRDVAVKYSEAIGEAYMTSARVLFPDGM